MTTANSLRNVPVTPLIRTALARMVHGMTEDAPIELYGFHPEREHLILARRAGEPTFVWVQDLGDAYQAAASRGVDVVVTRQFRDELLAHGESPLEVQGLRII